jgi:anti-sigma-K factor RskA
VALAGTEHEPRARARVIVDPATGRALLYAYDLPILPEGAVYELWAIRGSTPQPAGTFVVDTAGRARFEVAGAAVLEGVDALAVTVEPAPGVPLPTGRMVLLSGS